LRNARLIELLSVGGGPLAMWRLTFFSSLRRRARLGAGSCTAEPSVMPSPSACSMGGKANWPATISSAAEPQGGPGRETLTASALAVLLVIQHAAADVQQCRTMPTPLYALPRFV
jgi:hypothetical protein